MALYLIRRPKVTVSIRNPRPSKSPVIDDGAARELFRGYGWKAVLDIHMYTGIPFRHPEECLDG